MDKLKISYQNFWPEWTEENFIQPILNKHFEVIIDNNNPDVVFHSIFGSVPNVKCKKILFLGENYRPQSFKSDYSISFDPHTETNYRLPLWQAFILNNPSYLDKLFNRVKHTTFDRFCSFTVSNGNNFIRNGVFNSINNYKQCHSYGRYMTNDLGLITASKNRYWRDAKEEFFLKNKHKFSIVYENTSYPYYTTEKLMDAFLVGSLPIYNGNPKIKQEFNEKAFINANTIHGDNLVNLIKLIDNKEDQFLEMYNQPVFIEDQKLNLLNNLNNFESFLINAIKK